MRYFFTIPVLCCLLEFGPGGDGGGTGRTEFCPVSALSFLTFREEMWGLLPWLQLRVASWRQQWGPSGWLVPPFLSSLSQKQTFLPLLMFIVLCPPWGATSQRRQDGCWLISHQRTSWNQEKVLPVLEAALCPLSSFNVFPCFLLPLRERDGDITGIWTWVPLLYQKGGSNCILDFVSLP